MRPDDAAIVDILAFAARAQRRTTGVDAGRFAGDEGLQDAVIRCLGVVGEAAARVSAATREAHPEVPWALMVGMRNRLVHEYTEVDMDEVYRTVTSDLPDLVRLLAPLAPSDERPPA